MATLWRGALCALVLVLGACSTSFRSGNPPPIERLAGLKAGVSTRADAIAALGTPQGYGAAGVVKQPEQEVLAYRYQETNGQVIRSQTLLVFVDKRGGLYRGYMWFRGGQVVGVNQ